MATTSTRMRFSSSTTVFHRIAEDGTAAAHDVGTSDAVASGLGGTGEFLIEDDSTLTHSTIHQVVDTNEAVIGGDVAIDKYIHIKNTGFTSADKDTAVAADAFITIGVGGAFASGGFTLMAGEAICLHGLGAGSDNLNQLQIDSSVAATYVEITYH